MCTENRDFSKKKMESKPIIQVSGFPIPMTVQIENAIKLISKIRKKYNHDEVGVVIKRMLTDYLKPGILSVIDKLKQILVLINQLYDILSVSSAALNIDTLSLKSGNVPGFAEIVLYGPDVRRMLKIVVEMNDLIEDMSSICKCVSSVIVDTYFIRRFMDKDYITNGISYTGAAHSSMYVHILIKYFDFKITHASYSKYDPDTLNKKIKAGELGYEFYSYFLPKTSQQCSDMSSFPKDFS